MDNSSVVAVLAGLRLARILAFGGISTGLLAGFIAFLTLDGAEAVAVRIADFMPIMAILIPISLAMVAWAAVTGNDADLVGVLRGRSAAQIMLIIGGLLGSALACLLYLVAAALVGGLIGGEDLNAVSVALVDVVGWTRPLVVVVLTTLVAVVLGFWSSNRLNPQR